MTAPILLPRTRAVRAAGRPLRIVAFGSSTTEGHGASGPDHTYPAVMRRALLPECPGGVWVSNQGIGGETCLEMDQRLSAVIEAEPDLVLWQTGANDVNRPVPLDVFVRLTRSGIGRLASTGADLVLMDQQYSRVMDEAPAFPAYLDALHGLAAEAGLPVFPRHAAMREWCAQGRFTRDGLSPDGTHMGDAGYEALGLAVAAWLLSRSGSGAQGPEPTGD